jgi:hypothetical protein
VDYNFDAKEQLEKFLINIIEKGNKPYHKSLIQWSGRPSKIFSIENKGIYKVINLLGLRIKIV